jgi:hypothetical protein
MRWFAVAHAQSVQQSLQSFTPPHQASLTIALGMRYCCQSVCGTQFVCLGLMSGSRSQHGASLVVQSDKNVKTHVTGTNCNECAFLDEGFRANAQSICCMLPTHCHCDLP